MEKEYTRVRLGNTFNIKNTKESESAQMTNQLKIFARYRYDNLKEFVITDPLKNDSLSFFCYK